MNELLKRLKNKESKIGIIGLGYVGIPLMLRYQEEGYKVIGFDISQKRIDELNKGSSPIEHIKSEKIRQAVELGFSATTDYSRVKDVDAIIICVPTPLNKYREPDLSHIIETTEGILPHLKKDQVISLESTTYPGTTEEEILTRVESKGFKVGKDFFLLFSPEREDPGRGDFTTRTIPKVVGGVSKNCLEVGIQLYSAIIDRVVPVSSTKTAEMTKLLENIHRAVNIGLVNELKVVCDKMGIDIHEVIDAAATKPFGFVAYRPGPGLGGHCIPIDPFYLTWKAREFGVHTRFIELAGEINSSMPFYVLKKVAESMNERKKPVNGSRFLILGLSYKKNVDDLRESPSIFIMEKLKSDGAILDYSDPHIAAFKSKDGEFDLKSVDLTPEVLAKYDCVIVTTDHDKFDYKLIAQHSKLIVDTRGRYRESSSHIVKA